jgi:ATP-dependent Lon protease
MIAASTLRLEEEPSAPTAPGSPTRIGTPGPAETPADLHALVANRALAILPTPDTVLFPLGVVPFSLDATGLAMINSVMAGDRLLAVFTQRVVDPAALLAENLYRVGTLAKVIRMARASEDSVHILVQGIIRVQLVGLETREPIVTGRLEVLDDELSSDVETEGLSRAVLEHFSKLVIMSSTLPDGLVSVVRSLHGAGAIADFVAANIDLPISEKQALLEERSCVSRALPAPTRDARLCLCFLSVSEMKQCC